jgi:hypothetical protein
MRGAIVTPVEYFTTAVAIAALLWSVVNDVRLRTHAKALQDNEAHLRVRSELKLRLHQESWNLLRVTQEAAFIAFNAIRTYQLTAIASFRGGPQAWMSPEYQTAQESVQKFTGLAHVTPPSRKDLRDAASAFAKVFNMVNHSVLGGPSPDKQMDEVMQQVTEALVACSAGTADWNRALWEEQTPTELLAQSPSIAPSRSS